MLIATAQKIYNLLVIVCQFIQISPSNAHHNPKSPVQAYL